MPGRTTRSRASTAAEQQIPPTSKSKVKRETSESSKKPSANQARKRKRDIKTEQDEPSTPPSKARKSGKAKGPSEKDLQAGASMAKGITNNRDAQRNESTPEHKARAKANPYGLSPGETPFPRYTRPTAEECHKVRNILAKVHGDVSAPKTIPTPSLNDSGCGEVPSILDALIRTRLSAATNNANSSRAFRGLVKKFGLINEGIGKGSVDWNKVRLADKREVFEAIQSGGLADVKSRDIQKILQLVWEENQARRQELAEHKQRKGGKADKVKEEDPEEREMEVKKAEGDVLSLDHLHLLSSEDAFAKLLTYPGIGPKTASCVLLFCMQRPSFAVDTHVFRLTKWLGWVPTEQQAKTMAKAEAKETGEKVKSATVTREKAYAHLDVRIPDELKYPLHYLLIKHGKHCGWCSAKAGAAAKVGTCPLAHLMSGKGRIKGSARKTKDELGTAAEQADEMDIDEEREEEEDDSVGDEDDTEIKGEDEDGESESTDKFGGTEGGETAQGCHAWESVVKMQDGQSGKVKKSKGRKSRTSAPDQDEKFHGLEVNGIPADCQNWEDAIQQ